MFDVIIQSETEGAASVNTFLKTFEVCNSQSETDWRRYNSLTKRLRVHN